MNEIFGKIAIHKKTAELVEITDSWMGKVAWLMEYNDIPNGALAVYPYVIYDDDVRFKDYEVIGDL